MKKKINWKLGAITLAALVLIFVGMTNRIKNGDNFKVVHFQEVKAEYGADGRAAVGSPEVYKIEISPAVNWEMSRNGTGVWRAFAWVMLVVCAAFIMLYGSGVISFGVGTNAPNYIWAGTLAIALACYIAAYSSAFTNNYIELSKAEYEKVKGDKAAIKQLFLNKKNYIR